MLLLHAAAERRAEAADMRLEINKRSEDQHNLSVTDSLSCGCISGVVSSRSY